MIRIAIFASGQGTNALQLLKTAKHLSRVQIPLVVVDQKDSPLPRILEESFQDIEVAIIPKPPQMDAESSRYLHEEMIWHVLQKHRIDWCFLAGYLRLIGPNLLQHFHGTPHSRMVNIHPSLLPAYPGLRAYERAFTANEKENGISIHFVDAGLDTGALIAQTRFARGTDDTLEQFMERGKKAEWELYAEVLARLDRDQSLSAISEDA